MALKALQRQLPCTPAAWATAALAALHVNNLSSLGTNAWGSVLYYARTQGQSPHPPRSRSLQAAHVSLQGPEDPRLVFAAEALAELLGNYTERLGEARSLLQKALEVSMVRVTLLCCGVLLAS